MTINVFEGARRIGKLIAVLWIAGVVAFTIVIWDPRIEVEYTISGANMIPVRSESPCPHETARERITVNTKKGTEAHVTLCLPPRYGKPAADSIEALVNKEFGFVAKPTPTGIVEYTFVLPPAEEDWIDGQWWTVRRKQLGASALWLFGGLAFLLGSTLTIGWIVRGVLGIPRGQDRRPTEG